MKGIPVVLYHHPCVDGAYAALAASLHFGKGKVDFVRHNVSVPFGDWERLRDKTVYLLDYSGPVGFVPQACGVANSVMLIDHHKTAQEHLETWRQNHDNFQAHFDLEQSGATLALGHFQPEIDTDLARVFSYVEDNDLWRHKLPDSKAFSAGMRSLVNLDSETLFESLLKLKCDEILERGRQEMAAELAIINAELTTRYRVKLANGVEIFSVDTQYPTLRSAMGNALALLSKNDGLAAIGAVCYEDKGLWKISLRSIGDEDTTRFSEAHGGGGHKNASSFSLASKSLWDAWRQ